MKTVIISMGVSLDGYVNDADGDFSWGGPSDELFAFHVQEVGRLSAYLLGRRLYEAMRVWETDEAMRATPERAAFADIWAALPKVVFSRTLDRVEGNARLARGSVAEELASVPDGVVSVGGATLAAEFIREDLIDEFRTFVHPVLVGGGTPYFPSGIPRLDLELLETREFSGIVYQRHRRIHSAR